jgi:hypothetical protein
LNLSSKENEIEGTFGWLQAPATKTPFISSFVESPVKKVVVPSANPSFGIPSLSVAKKRVSGRLPELTPPTLQHVWVDLQPYYWAFRGGFNNVTGGKNWIFVNNDHDSPDFLTYSVHNGRAFTGRIRFLGRK